MSNPDFAEIRAALEPQVESLCRHYFPDGRKNGQYWFARNPTRPDKTSGSFYIHLRHPKGAYADKSSGQHGDIIKLIGLAIGTDDLKQIRIEACRYLGWQVNGQSESKEERKKRLAQIEARRRQAEHEAALENEKNRWRAFKLWQKAQELTGKTYAGSLAERYLLSRGIDLQRDWLAHGRPLPGAIRLFAAHDYRLDTGEIHKGLPCLISLMSGADGKPAAIHRTWLSPAGLGKADLPRPEVNKARKMWPSFAGTQAVIRVAKGEGNLSPEEAARQGKRARLIVTEGVEDALSAMIACPGHRVWAAGSLSNLQHVPVLPCVSSITVCADNDWDKPQAVAQLDQAIAALKRQGVPVFVARSWHGKDVNDLLMGKGN